MITEIFKPGIKLSYEDEKKRRGQGNMKGNIFEGSIFKFFLSIAF
jgi:hypothetical protein